MAEKIFFIVNTPEFFLSHRLPIACAAREAGYEVHIVTGAGSAIKEIIDLGFAHHCVDIVRSGQNPLRELKSIIQLYRLFQRFKPDLVHLVTIKPVLYGGIAARLAGVPAVVAAVSGLGTVFTGRQVGGAALRRWLVSHLYRFAFRQRQLVVIFQNPDDRDTLLCLGVVRSQQTRIIRGSGVSLDEYPYVPEPQSRPVVVMASRLLKDKGVCEFVEAARLLQSRNVDVLMRLIGSPDPGNLSSITTEEMNDWKHEGIVDLMGYRTDIAEQYAASNIVCLPSYREGLPKSLIEAAACGRAVVTTDVPGCRDAIEPGITGLLVPPRDPGALADAIEHLIENPSELKNMGRAGRRLAEREFGIDKIVNQHLEIYRELLSND